MYEYSILKPDMRTLYLDKREFQKISYLRIPQYVNKASLTRDIGKGAVQFQEIPRLSEKERVQYIVIRADSEEQGYLAVMYLAACFNQNEHNYADWEYEEEERRKEVRDVPFTRFSNSENAEGGTETEEECWEEDPFKIPVICLSEITSKLNKERNSVSLFEGLPMLEKMNQTDRKCYWMDCKTESVCIIYRKSPYEFGNPGDYTEALKYFKRNKRIYILFLEENTNFWDYHLAEDKMTSLSTLEMERNSIVLDFVAEELEVKLPEEKKKVYYKFILKGFMEKYHVQVKKGFSYQRILNCIMAMQRDDICNLIEKIVIYAIKDKKDQDKILLGNEDFKFIERFVRTAPKKANKKQNARECLNTELIGMEEIKEQVLDIVNVMKYNKLRANMKICGGTYHNTHLMIGAPGTAKTTVAKLMGQIMLEEKLLQDNRFICINGAELKGMYVGHSAPKTKALFRDYDVIVIDEAYSLVDDSGETDSFSKEAISQLIIELEEHSMDKLVIFAGYGGKDVSARNDKMKAFVDANPGIKSRITSTFYFPSYCARDMVQIFHRIAQVQHYDVQAGADTILYEYFEKRVTDENFGNGREARSLLETCVLFAAKRVFSGKGKHTVQEMKEIRVEDICQAIASVYRASIAQTAEKSRRVGFCQTADT